VLILDEPTDGLDPVMRDDTFRVLTEHLSDTPTTVLLSTHHVGEVESLADHIGVLANGRLRAQMRLDELRSQMRRYRASVPPDWQGGSILEGAVMRRITTQHEIDWTVWGDDHTVARELTTSGATVLNAAPLTLEEATLLLLTTTETVR
jgi:ABC-2 type transport system ATP-binding protein